MYIGRQTLGSSVSVAPAGWGGWLGGLWRCSPKLGIHFLFICFIQCKGMPFWEPEEFL